MDLNDAMIEKISKRVEMLFTTRNGLDDLENVSIKDVIQKKLFPYQILHLFNMITAIKNNDCVIDGSTTGLGKTYTSAALCSQLNYKPIIICTKTMMSTWKRVLEYFNVDYIMIVNYETIRTGKYYDANNNKVDCPYITKEKNGFKWNLDLLPSSNKHKNIPIIIFDEVHRCRNSKSLNGKLLLSCKKIKNIMISATLCDKNKDFGIFGVMLGFYRNVGQGKSWMEAIIRENKNQISKNKVNMLHKYLFPEKGSKMSIEDMGNDFPKNIVSFDCFDVDIDDMTKINNYYTKIKKNNDISKLSEIIKMREFTENIKSDIFIDLMMDYRDQGKSIVLFVNFVSTFDIICTYLDKENVAYSKICGNQTIEDRETQINNFQSNDVDIIVCMIQAGGTSLSLHDINDKPRVSIISPSFSRIELLQALGRIYRAGTKSLCLQRVIYCSNTYEELISKKINEKKQTLDLLTDDDVCM